MARSSRDKSTGLHFAFALAKAIPAWKVCLKRSTRLYFGRECTSKQIDAPRGIWLQITQHDYHVSSGLLNVSNSKSNMILSGWQGNGFWRSISGEMENHKPLSRYSHLFGKIAVIEQLDGKLRKDSIITFCILIFVGSSSELLGVG